MTLDELIRSQFEATYAGCDPGIDEENPRKYSLGWYSEGVFYGIKLGQQIGQEVRTEDAKIEWQRTWQLGYLQALNYLAFSISHLTLNRAEHVKAIHGGELMREQVIDLIHAAINSELIRQRAQVKGGTYEAEQDHPISKKTNGQAS